MTTASIAYGTATAMTILLTGLASSSTLLAGRESTAVDNSSTLAIDYIVGGKVTTSGTGTPLAGQIEIWAYGSYDGTTYSGGATGSDAGLTFAAEKPLLALLQVIPTDTTAAHVYEWGPKSIAQAFGGVVPKKWGIFIVHNTSAALNATVTNHEVKYTAINYTSA